MVQLVSPLGHAIQSGVRVPAGASHSRESERRQRIPLCNTKNLKLFSQVCECRRRIVRVISAYTPWRLFLSPLNCTIR